MYYYSLVVHEHPKFQGTAHSTHALLDISYQDMIHPERWNGWMTE